MSLASLYFLLQVEDDSLSSGDDMEVLSGEEDTASFTRSRDSGKVKWFEGILNLHTFF